MYKTPTVFVVGAGASYEIGMPTGIQLRDKIVSLLQIEFEFGNRQKSGSRKIAEALKKYADYDTREGSEEYNAHLRAGWHIGRALSQAISIDNFIENLEDERVERMAKLAIAEAILTAERESDLFKALERDDNKPLDWRKIESTWYHSFFQTLVEGRRRSDLRDIFKNISIITFNYDRSIEYFLSKALVNYYGLDEGEAAEIVSDIPIIHPYGRVGRLRWQKGKDVICNFGETSANSVYQIGQSIKTFSERLADDEFLRGIKTMMAAAEQVVFLGFAFHDANMDLLQPEKMTSAKRVLGTAKGISAPDINVISDRIEKLLPSISNESEILIVKDLVCVQLFYDFSRTLRQ